VIPISRPPNQSGSGPSYRATRATLRAPACTVSGAYHGYLRAHRSLSRTASVLGRTVPEVAQCERSRACRGRPLAGDNDPAWRCFTFKPRGDVHAVAVQVVAVHDQVTDVQANTEDEPLVLGPRGIGFMDGPLELDGGPEGVYGAPELGQCPVAPPLRSSAGSNRSFRCSFRRARVPASSRPMRRE
jgi:hypothetical protein